MALPQIFLSIINESPKGIPYAGGDVREDGSQNYGFVPLKGKPAEAALIPEVQDNEPMKNALLAINESGTAFFTAGCEKSFNDDPDGHWAKGYIEVSFNYINLASDAQSYFKLFFDFNNRVAKNRFEAPVRYHWELEGAVFLDISWETVGFTVGIWITTALLESRAEVESVWAQAVDFLTEYLKEVKVLRQHPSIY
jgi:hypothetical protein